MSKCFSWFALSCLIATGAFGWFEMNSARANDQAAKAAAQEAAAKDAATKEAAAKIDAEGKAAAAAKAAADAKAADEAAKNPADAKVTAKPDQATLEKDFEKLLSGCVFVGKFTVVGRENQAPKEERYTIIKVKKQPSGKWIFVARIEYGKNDIQVPMELDVEWAGDTPVITLTDLTIPGLGTFTSRVLVYRGWYSGTWQHGEVGGHLFGKIEKLPPPEKKTDKKVEAKTEVKDEKKEEK
jgi:hypothetical protein